ncbi:type II secretion system minor pseudopilin GspK [Acinetobacter gerneri]|uniref:Type II secretion system protein K n=1 Tax=Acinetobacter gerneri TaxID=202952 RepID=A0AAW8JSE5_9GAMM|nr:type II secretion system minor pseudopilin GspK [Acinetobacter gerneri]MDQ9011192.1 type II secretion system minor pseudopilin GspK [Acinetobacter gerneri]MDQ9015298.1 type II secretion system minor pseudopilin GspK [Acinetobacter gerneri]MDQ9026469.1 type II secretion system minor pseudopilin GspK [Acinetobacter gerneri]MDQ9053750.1 type II secretion system minor pseudopilin GspK [Acinetobacter gerneri]MDQ9061450.1 type II secretion system minor pseudopilin GspK [Acinetobacter gerneri]
MKQQRGVALITILIMVALATILAATIAKRQMSTTEDTAYLIRQNQSLLYAKSAEAFFSELLIQDSQNAPNVDDLQETWAKPMPPFPVDGGTISGLIVDESGKFNLNSLLKSDGTPNDVAKAYFEKLLQRVGLPAELSQAVIDWQDPDDATVGSMGAESSYYQGLTKPYLTPNSKFRSVEELKLVRGFEGNKYKLIEAYVTASPDINSKININTAPALVLASIDPNVNVNAVNSLLEEKLAKLEHFNTAPELLATAPFSNLEQSSKDIANRLFDVKSNYFKAQTEVVLNNRKRQFSSYLYRNNKQVYVYTRSLAPF